MSINNPTTHEGDDDYFGPKRQWNIEQATRRALRSLERRGLVELGCYSFTPGAERGRLARVAVGSAKAWNTTSPANRVT
jgi:hypothetical protein